MKKETQLSVLKEIRDLLKEQSIKEISGVEEEYRTIIVPKGYTIKKALQDCKKLFLILYYWNVNTIDKKIISDRTSKKAYSIRVKNVQEADEELKNLSANELKEKGIQGITLLERIVLELDYFKETGKHLDIDNWTLCSGSRDADGYVPYAYWSDSTFRVDWFNPDSRNDSLRSRAVSVTS